MMLNVRRLFGKADLLKRYYYKLALIIAAAWVFLDFTNFISLIYTEDANQYPFTNTVPFLNLLRLTVGVISFVILAYWLIFRLKGWLRFKPVWVNFLVKSSLLTLACMVMETIFFYIVYVLLYKNGIVESFSQYRFFAFDTLWLFHFASGKFMIFLITLFALEINEKYSPGVFGDIFLGKYLFPREENRIIAFIDLKNSTPIAEKLGHREYFYFIRNFIHHISQALLQYDGLIYQYVGDEIVVSWLNNRDNTAKSLKSLRKAQQIMLSEAEYYQQRYGVEAAFRTGIHCGLVTVGEIGIVKKDLAISGDAMNTAARIRSMSGELDYDFLASGDFVNSVGLPPAVVTSLGDFELKGKGEKMEIFALNFQKGKTEVIIGNKKKLI